MTTNDTDRKGRDHAATRWRRGPALRKGLMLLPSIALLAAALPAPTLAQAIDQKFYYKLSTQFRGGAMKLDVFNGGPKNNLTRLQRDQDVSGQLWRFVGNPDGTYRLTTMFRGSRMCLDIFNGGPNNNQPQLRNCGNYAGQFWNVAMNGAGKVRLTTVFRGPGMCLDVFNGGPNNNQPELRKCGNYTGQFWKLTKTSTRVAD